MKEFGHFYLDIEKDMIVDLYEEDAHLFYVLRTPNHHTGNLITNFAKLTNLQLSEDAKGLKIIQGEVPCYIDGENQSVYILRFGNTKVANIYPDGRIERKASVPSISKTLMSQTKDYKLDEQKTIIKTYIFEDCKFRTDLHTHMNANLAPDILIALGIIYQIRYPYYYVRKLQLQLSDAQKESLKAQREAVSRQYEKSGLEGKYLQRRIDDNTFINFADLILQNLENSENNISKIRASLTILKDGQAVFTNLEKVYLYRYVFCKGVKSEDRIDISYYRKISDRDIVRYVDRMIQDGHANWSLFQSELLWIARSYQSQGIRYVEISDTALVKKEEAFSRLKEIHEVMPFIYEETKVRIRFLAAMRRIPLILVKEQEATNNYLKENIEMLKAICVDPYIAGCDFVGEEINSILELKEVFREVVRITEEDPTFVIRVHAGENDSLRNNVADTIRCIRSYLKEGQKMPQVRIGHGLYTSDLNSRRGKKLIQDLKENGVILEFQITSNVRLNNLNSIEEHPLREYLKQGIRCVQGTDGAAIYGTTPMDEQLSLEKLLGMNKEELLRMRQVEEEVITFSEKAFKEKSEKLAGSNWLEVYQARLTEATLENIQIHSVFQYDASAVLKKKIREYPWDKMPIVLCGGSFNTEKRKSEMNTESLKVVDALLRELDPKKVFFVIGHTLSAYEGYLLEHKGSFEVFSVVPAVINRTERELLKNADVAVRISTEIKGMAIYKSFNYEIFERRNSVVLAFDGNSPAANLIQEARNGKGNSTILIDARSASLRKKAESLEGYAKIFASEEEVMEELKECRK